MFSNVETSQNAGICFIKTEFLVKDHERNFCPEHVAKEDIEKFEKYNNQETEVSGSKRMKLENMKLKGQNKDRRKADASVWKTKQEFCPNLTDSLGSNGEAKCSWGESCKFQHDPLKYLALKPPDIGKECYVFRKTGYCPWGISCRFGGEHLTNEGVNIKDESSGDKTRSSLQPVNVLDKETVTKLWKKRYNFDLSIRTVKETERVLKSKSESNSRYFDESKEGNCFKQCVTSSSDTVSEDGMPVEDERMERSLDGIKTIGSLDDSDEVQLRLSEKKRLDWKGLIYLSPLTTVGNLPFRRICVDYGADITCSEMTLALSLLQGTREWSLVKRHPSEKIFGVQICGNNPMIMTKTAQLLEENASVDFIDINLGCPIDALYQQGCGSGMMARKGLLVKTCYSMSRILKETPLTVKLRTGITMTNPLAHNLMPIFSSAGVSLATIHGRSREQRYTKNADWDYIDICATAATPMPVFGNGDVLSFEDYNRFTEIAPNCSGVMVGRGALIKPWIFEEIKQQKHIDISSSERFDVIKKYVNYGMEHWGSDTRGVETTRRFLLEWLSFLYRYVPLGLLERVPQAINQRPPLYRGRDDMETLMASGNCSDWIKISEMLLGPVPEGFVFLPKHKSNAWK